MRKNRRYKKEEPHRDANLFVIVTEGGKREPDYFAMIQSSRIIVKTVHPGASGKSAPEHLIERAQDYAKENGMGKDDNLWFVLDKDDWGEEKLKDVYNECKDNLNWELAISNPCFEVWLHMHCWDIDNSYGSTCKELKQELDQNIPGGYKVEEFVPTMNNASQQAKTKDQTSSFIPEYKRTKVYQLAEKLLNLM